MGGNDAAPGVLLLLPDDPAVARLPVVEQQPRVTNDLQPAGGPNHVRLATWLSLLPGGGQLVNREGRKAAAFLVGVVGLLAVSLNIPAVTDTLIAWWRPRGGLAVALSLALQMLSLVIFVGVFVAALAFWYAAMHDARRVARARSGQAVRLGRWWFFHR